MNELRRLMPVVFVSQCHAVGCMVMRRRAVGPRRQLKRDVYSTSAHVRRQQTAENVQCFHFTPPQATSNLSWNQSRYQMGVMS
jgi:hypothetical protein